MNKVLLIGTGGCGNKLLNTAINILSKSIDLQCTYDCVFVNSNEKEMKILPNYMGSNALAITGNGTGRSRKVASASISNEKSKFISFFNQTAERYDLVFIISSADGGFGSGSVPVIASVLKTIKPSLSVGILGVMPVKSSRGISFENAISFHNDIVDLRDNGIVNSIQYIDNNKMLEEDKFNGKVMKEFIDSLELYHGAVDGTDIKEVNSASNYKVILQIKNDLGFDLALAKAWKDSPFLMPKGYTCTHICGTLVKGTHDKDDVFENIEVSQWDKIDYGDKNFLILGGCSMPTDFIDNIKYLYDELALDSENTDNAKDKVEFSAKPKQSKSTMFQAEKGKKELSKEERMMKMLDSYFKQ